MSAPTANLQSGRLSVRQAAELMNVSERSIYTATRILRSGRQDLIEKIERGEMSLHAATRIFDGNDKQPDRFAALCRAWNKASEAERLLFLKSLGGKS